MSKLSFKFSGLVLAAGYSSRMKDWKPALKIGELPMIISTVKPMLDHCGSIVIVGGFNFERLKKIILEEDYFSKLQKEKIILIENENFSAGMFSSIKKGLLYSEQNDGVFITPGDIPFVKSSTYSSLIKNFMSDFENMVLIPVSKVDTNPGSATDMVRKGHPILIRSEVIPEIIDKPDDMSLRNVLEAFPSGVCRVNDSGIFLDVDDKKDLERVKQFKSEK